MVRGAVVAVAAVLEAAAGAHAACFAGRTRLAGAFRAGVEGAAGAILADALVVGVAASDHLPREAHRATGGEKDLPLDRAVLRLEKGL